MESRLFCILTSPKGTTHPIRAQDTHQPLITTPALGDMIDICLRARLDAPGRLGILCSSQHLAQYEHIGSITNPCPWCPARESLARASGLLAMAKDTVCPWEFSPVGLCESDVLLRLVVKGTHLDKVLLYQAVAWLIVRDQLCCCLDKICAVIARGRRELILDGQ